MKTLCCICNKTMIEGPEDPPSHGICKECFPDYINSQGLDKEDVRIILNLMEVEK